MIGLDSEIVAELSLMGKKFWTAHLFAQHLFDQLDLQSLLSSHDSTPDRQPEHLTIEIVALSNPDRDSANPAFHRLH